MIGCLQTRVRKQRIIVPYFESETVNPGSAGQCVADKTCIKKPWQCGILTCIDSDEPVKPPLKFRTSKWRSVSSLTAIEYSSDLHRLWSDCARLVWAFAGRIYHINGNLVATQIFFIQFCMKKAFLSAPPFETGPVTNFWGTCHKLTLYVQSNSSFDTISLGWSFVYIEGL